MCLRNTKPVDPPEEREFYKVMYTLASACAYYPEYGSEEYFLGERYEAQDADNGYREHTPYEPGFHGFADPGDARLYTEKVINAVRSVMAVVRCLGMVFLEGEILIPRDTDTITARCVVASDMTILEEIRV